MSDQQVNRLRVGSYFARSVREANLPYFNVTGGPFASAQTMGWHIVNEKGFTVAVSPDDEFAARLNELESLASLIRKLGAAYHLSERHDDGYLEVPDEIWESWKETVTRLRLDESEPAAQELG